MLTISGSSQASLEQMKTYLRTVNPNAPQGLEELYLKEGAIEGIRGDVAFVQSCKETNFYKFGGQAKIEWNNSAGLGVTGQKIVIGYYTDSNGAQKPIYEYIGNKFPSWQVGIQAHIQHAFAYAKASGMPYQKLVDLRFHLVPRGSAQHWEELSGKWAYPGTTYGQDIVKRYNEMLQIGVDVQDESRIPFTIMTEDELLAYCKTFNWTRSITEFHVHHTYSPNHDRFNGKPDHIYWQYVMYRYHTITNGWRDIAQHISLYPDGRFVTGRDFNWTPASGYDNYNGVNQNKGVFMVETIGNFDKGYDKFQGVQADSLFTFMSNFLVLKQVPLTGIKFHRELPGANKTCPGTSINKEDFVGAIKIYQIYKV